MADWLNRWRETAWKRGLTSTRANCKHCSTYTSRSFDVLNGFELIAVRCSLCHKILELNVKKF